MPFMSKIGTALLVGAMLVAPIKAIAQSAPPIGEAKNLPEHANRVAIDGLLGSLQLNEMLDIMIEEELAFGEDLRADMLPDMSKTRWQRDLRVKISAGELRTIFTDAFTRTLDGMEAPLKTQVVTFGADPLVVKAIDLEVKARRLLLDADVENAAYDHAVKSEKTSRFKAISTYINALDLVETNVAGSLNSNLVFYREMVMGGAFPYEVSEQQMVSDVAGEADAMRQEIGEWLTAYLNMAYAPMSDAEFERFSTLATSDAGRAFYHAADRGYDAVFSYNSKVLGAMIAGHIAGEAL
jgi:hypothetical protein